MSQEYEVSRRCSMCAVNWPDAKGFRTCPECGDETSRIRDITPIDAAEARSRKLRAEFEAFYEKWDAEHDPDRLKPVDGFPPIIK